MMDQTVKKRNEKLRFVQPSDDLQEIGSASGTGKGQTNVKMYAIIDKPVSPSPMGPVEEASITGSAGK